MSDNRRPARHDTHTEFSYGRNERHYSGIYLNREYLDDISIMVPNNPGSTGETINGHPEVVHPSDPLNLPQQDSATMPGPSIHTAGSNGTPESLNLESDRPVVKTYYKNYTAHGNAFNMEIFVHIPNTRHRRPLNHCNENLLNTRPYLTTTLQHNMMPEEQSESERISENLILNAGSSNSTERRPSNRYHYSDNNNYIHGIRQYKRYSSLFSPSSSNCCESDIKYCQPTQNLFETFDVSKRDPRLMNCDRNASRSRLMNSEELKPINYNTNKETCLDEDLRIINMKLKNMNSSYRFLNVHDLLSADNLNEHNIRRGGEPRVENSQTDREPGTHVNCNKHFNILSTERYQNLNVRKMIDAIHVRSGNVDVLNDTETTGTLNVLEQNYKHINELIKSREDDQNKLAETVKNIIDRLNDDISDFRCTPKTLSETNDGMIKTHDLNDKTNNNIKKANEKNSSIEHSNVDNTQKNIDNICGLIENHQNYKRLSGRSTEDTADVRTNQNVETGTFASKLKDTIVMSTAKEDNSDKMNESSENSVNLNTNKNESNVKNIILNKDHYAVDQRKTPEKKLHKQKPKKLNKSKNNNKHSEMYVNRNSRKADCEVIKTDFAIENTNSDLEINRSKTTDEQTNNAGIWTALFKQQKKTDENELISEPDGKVQLGNETDNTKKTRRRKNARESIENIQNEVLTIVESINSETSVGEQSNPNTSTENSATSVTNVGEETHYTHDKPSTGVQDSDETTEPNFTGRFTRHENHESSRDFGKLVSGINGVQKRGTNEDSLKSNTAQSLPNPEQGGPGKDKEEQLIECSENMLNDNSTVRESNEELFKTASFENVDDEQCMSKYLNNDTNETDIYESPADASKLQAVVFMLGNSSPGDHNIEYGSGTERSMDSFLNYVLNENPDIPEASESNKGLKIQQNECEDIEAGEIIDDEDQLSNVQCLPGDDVLPDDEPPADEPSADEPSADEPSADEPSADEQPADVQPVCGHFEMDYFYNIIKLKHSLFRVNLLTEDDIFNFIQLYSQRTQTSWGVLKSFISGKYVVCKTFRCLHNGLGKLLKNPDEKIKLNNCECRSKICVKIKWSTAKRENRDCYLKFGLPAIVEFKNDHNHLVCKGTELPLLKSITDNNVKITYLDKSFDPAKIRQAYNAGNRPNLNPPVSERISSEEEGEIVEITGNNLFRHWEDVEVQCDIVETNSTEHLGPGQQVINNGTSHYQLVNTKNSKKYCRKLKNMISNCVKTKWMNDKMTTEADQVSLYKCSGKKCNAVFSRRKMFVPHVNDHCLKAKSKKKTRQFMKCMYCLKSFGKMDTDTLADHIFFKHSYCKYFCQYCLYRAYTPSHVLVHEFIFHDTQKPSILQLNGWDRSSEIVKVVDFEQFVLRYCCNIGTCAFYSYTDSDFLYHLSHDHVECDKFYCDICNLTCNENGLVASNPTSFVKHFDMHKMDKYQCIFCLFGAKSTNIMIIHLAMVHFEYKPLCLERRPINDFCDPKMIENLKILSIKKTIPDGIVKVVNVELPKNLDNNELQTSSADTCTNANSVNIENITQPLERITRNVVFPSESPTKPEDDDKNRTILSNEAERNVPIDDAQDIPNSGASVKNDKNKSSQLTIYDLMKNIKLKRDSLKPTKRKSLETPLYNNELQTSSADTCTNANSVNIENITQPLERITRNVFFPSENPTKPEDDDKNRTILSNKAERNVPIDDAQDIPNSGASVKNDKNKSSQLTIYDLMKNIKLKRNSLKPTKRKSLETPLYKNELQTSSADTCTNANSVNIENITQPLERITRNVVFPSENPTKPEDDDKNRTILTNKAERNVPIDDAQDIPNSGASVKNDKNKSSQLTIYDLMKNIKLKRDSLKPTKRKSLETPLYNNELQTSSADTCTNANSVNIENITQPLERITRNVVFPSEKTRKPEDDDKNRTILSNKAERNVPIDDAQDIPNSGASVKNDKNKSSQLTIYDLMKNIKLKRDSLKPTKRKSLETSLSDKPIDQSKLISNKSSDKVIPAGISYQEHLNKCPTESPMECTFCLEQSESTFDIVKIPNLLLPNGFGCTFCNLELPSRDVAKSHVKEAHNISNVKFVPVDINATDIEKGRFLVCEDKHLKRKKRANDSTFYTDICKNMTIAHIKRSKVDNKDDDFQSTTIGCTTNGTSEQQIRRDQDESEQQHKTTKRKHSVGCTDNTTDDVDYKKTACWKRLYNTIPGSTVAMYISPCNIDRIPQTKYFPNPLGCLLCEYRTIVRSDLVLHLNLHRLEPVVPNKPISKSVLYKPRSAETASGPVNNSLCNSFKAKQNKKVKTVENSIHKSTIKTIETPASFIPGNRIYRFVPRNKRFQCPMPECKYIAENMEILGQHIERHQQYPVLYICPHCRPFINKFYSLHALEGHFNFHGTNLYICPYCNYYHYDRLKIESHQKRKHPSIMDDKNERDVFPIRNYKDLKTPKWKCNICNSGIEYTLPQMSTHLSTVHNILRMFKCPTCQFDHSDYNVFEEHFKLNHPFLEVKYMNVHFEKISPDVELQPANNKTKVDKYAQSKESHSLKYGLKVFNRVAEPKLALSSSKETPIKSTRKSKTFAELLDVSEDRRKILENPSSEPNDLLKSICPMAKYKCPVCNVFVVEEKESFRKHLLKEINCTLWKCLECFTISDSANKMKTHILKHSQLKQEFEKIEISKKNSLVDAIIEHQNKLMEHNLLKRNNQHTDCDDQNGIKHGNRQ